MKKITYERRMVDFYTVKVKEPKNSRPIVYPDWVIGRSKDLMIRGRSFYAVWDEEKGLWSTDEYDVQRLVDEKLVEEASRFEAGSGIKYSVAKLSSYDSQSWSRFRKFIQNVSDNSHQLDEKLTFANTKISREDYVSRRLPYDLEDGSHEAWDSLLSVLYSKSEIDKIEWAIGSVVSGDSVDIQKFLVFYGSAGTGKSTILNIIQKLFPGYYTTFDAKALASSNNSFSTEAFKDNPLVAIQHDGDLSKIEDNSKLNSIISHEYMTMNEKYKASYMAKANAFLFMGTNQPVKISDAKSGIIRRLIDVRPTGNLVPAETYISIMDRVDFELGAIAHKCLNTYLRLGKHYYDDYKPVEMMLQTDVFLNYVEYHYDIFSKDNGITLKRAYALYKEFAEETGLGRVLPQYKFREELRNYFVDFKERAFVNGKNVRSYYEGLKPLYKTSPKKLDTYKIDLNTDVSIFDSEYANQKAQYAKPSGAPGYKWSNTMTKLKDLDTSELHWVLVPEKHIVLDFDLVNEDGEKDLQRNLEAAAKLPPTYTEVSKSGSGLHLHYIYTGDVSELSSVYDVGVEIKTLLGSGALRRKLSLCNDLDISTITSGLPLKEKKVIDEKVIKSERALRDLINRNLRKEFHPGTKPSVDFIKTILDEAYESDLSYDVTDMRGQIFIFASGSTNQAETSMKTVDLMKFASSDKLQEKEDPDTPIAFFDVEVYPNLFVVCWKYEDTPSIVKMVNPSPEEIEELFRMKLIGFNNRRYDNHILYARYLGFSNEELYRLSQRIIVKNDKTAFFPTAYNLSYADIYDFSSKKQGLKLFEIELGIHHLEMDLPWDDPVDEKDWGRVIEYCCNDVVATEAVFKNRKDDFNARKILSKLSGLSINHSTQNHTARIIFGKNKYPQDSFVYTDLSKEFPGYEFDGKNSKYKGEITGEGGYVYAEPGIYEDVVVLDIASMHPTTIRTLNLFGKYTDNFSKLLDSRLAIKHGEFEKARDLLEGFEVKPEDAEGLSYALKIVINTVYGLTSARFENPFRDVRNKDNIVAKRGALFMVDLKRAVQEKGYTVAHIKTDSIKIPGGNSEIINFIMDFGKKYGYTFEHETTYSKFCLVNDAVYIAKDTSGWTAVGAQFQHPFVFKTLFSQEEPIFEDYCETKNVTKGRMFLEFEDGSDMVHVGRTGQFIPVKEGGGSLWRIDGDKKYAVTGTKGFMWVEKELYSGNDLSLIDESYFNKLIEKSVETIEKYGSFSDFVSQ